VALTVAVDATTGAVVAAAVTGLSSYLTSSALGSAAFSLGGGFFF